MLVQDSQLACIAFQKIHRDNCFVLSWTGAVTMSVACGHREFVSSLVSAKHIERWSGRGLCTSQISCPRRYDGELGRLRWRGLRAAGVSVSGSDERQRRRAVCVRSSVESKSATEDGENGRSGEAETAGGLAGLRRGTGVSSPSDAAFDGCIAESLPRSEQKVFFSLSTACSLSSQE